MNGFTKGIELGVKEGWFSLFLCNTVPDIHMTAVDRWAPAYDQAGEGAVTYVDWPNDMLYEQFKNEAAKLYPDRLDVLRMATADAALLVPDASVDFIFVDADHTYEGVLRDINDWTPKIAKGGILAGHDYNWPSVRKAVVETGDCNAVLHDNVWIRDIM